MKVWVKTSIDQSVRSEDNTPAIKYMHVFTGKDDPEGYVIIDKSLIEFADHQNRRNFQKPGEKIFLSNRAIDDGQYDLHDNIITFIIKGIFEGDFVLNGNSFRINI